MTDMTEEKIEVISDELFNDLGRLAQRYLNKGLTPRQVIQLLENVQEDLIDYEDEGSDQPFW